MNWPELVIGAFLGALAGLEATIIYQAILDRRQKKDLLVKCAGTWEREFMTEYHVPDRDIESIFQSCRGLAVHVSAQGKTALAFEVCYDDSRGIASAVINLKGSSNLEGDGAYSYKRPVDPCFGNAGWYTIHLVSDDRMYVYYRGTKPEKDLRGYEIWRRTSKKQLAIDPITRKVKETAFA